MPLLVNREIILAKIETTYNVDPTPTGAANAILVTSPSWAHEGARMHERRPITASLAPRKQIYGGSLKTIKFDCEIKGSGAAGTAPELGPLLRGCAHGETIVGATSVTYKPVSSTHESLTLYFYQDGTLHKITGARGTYEAKLDVGGIGMLSFTFTGHAATVTDTALATPTYNAQVPVPFIGASFAIGGYAAVIASLGFSANNQLSMRPSPSATDGFGDILIVSRDLNGSMDPEHTLVATNDFIGQWKAGTSMALDTGVIGATAGNRYRVQMPAIYYRDVAPADREGARTLALGFGAVESTTDDEVSIIFT